MKSKACIDCGIVKPLTEYGKNSKPHRPTQERAECRACQRVRDRKRRERYRAENPLQVPREDQREAALEMARASRTKATADMIEDVEFMLTHREGMTMAAIRLGMRETSLERALERQHRSDLVAQLKGNQYSVLTNQKEYY